MTIQRHHKGLLLDLDGTLADNMSSMQKVYYTFLSDAGACGSDSEFQRLNGVPIRQVVDSLKYIHSLTESSEKLVERYWLMVQQINLKTLPMKGALDLLHEARNRNRHVAVVTSTPRRLAEEWLSRNQLLEKIDAVVGSDEVSPGKPAPNPYILGLARIDCDARGSLAVEDSPLGATAAIAAGITTIGLSARRDGRTWPPAAKIVFSLSEIVDLL